MTLTGNVIAHERTDYFTFRDASGEITPVLFRGRPVGPETNVRIMGEGDRGLRGRYVWVKTPDVLA